MTEYSQQLVIEASHPCFQGHFPGNPLLPGALLLLRLQLLLEEQLPDWQLQHIKSAKFLAPVRPGDTVAVQWRAEAAQAQQQRRVRLRAAVAGKQVCQASLVMQPKLQPA